MNRVLKVVQVILIMGVFGFVGCKDNPEEKFSCYVEGGMITYSDYSAIFNQISSPQALTNSELLQVKSKFQKKTIGNLERYYDLSEQDLRDYANGRMTSEQVDAIISGLKQNKNSIVFFEVLGNADMVMWIYVAKSY